MTEIILKIKIDHYDRMDFSSESTIELSDFYLLGVLDRIAFSLNMNKTTEIQEILHEKAKTHIQDVGFSTRLYNCLADAHKLNKYTFTEPIIYLEDICKYSERDIKNIRLMGLISMNELSAIMHQNGLRFKP